MRPARCRGFEAPRAGASFVIRELPAQLTIRASARLPAEAEDVTYTTDAVGGIVAYDRAPWDRFALENETPALADEAAVLGASVYDAIEDEDTRIAARGMAELVLTGVRRRVLYRYRCDGPHCGREMLMEITPVPSPGGPPGLRYRSRVVLELDDEPAAYMIAAAQRDAAQNLPVITVCSYCQHVHRGDTRQPGAWIDPEQYYREGGTNHVRVTHGICPSCNDLIVEPQLALLDRPER
jgi:hypothetical protein